MHIVCLLSIAIPGRVIGAAQAKAPSSQVPKVLGTLELRGVWKATLFSKPFPFMVRRPDGNDVQLTNTLCYVDVLSADSNTPRRVWQRDFVALEGLEAFVPHGLTLGPVDEQRFCLAYLQGLTLYSFILDSRIRLNPTEDAPASAPSKVSDIRAAKKDPNGIDLREVIDEKRYPDLRVDGLSIAGVCGFAESRMVHLLGQNKQGVVLRYQPGEKKLTCQVFQLSEIAK
jgi:hypothetical protein